MNDRDTSGRLSRYLGHLHTLTGADPVIREILPPGSKLGRALAAIYANVPEPGYLTGFTYGLSLADHAEWTSSRRELSVTVCSDDFEWATIPSRAVGAMRGVSAFHSGRAFGHMERFIDYSDMSSLLLASPAGQWNSGTLDLGPGEFDSGERDVVELVGAYPIYASEREFVKLNGFDAFWGLEWDRFDPLRAPVA
ncbi:suppressor of fused domain protein [Kitasatospora purpeofusca]|uniref:suppressor of fused domain protein n=1 Tax=Kitasatospora purpeofusca TaxID=67352 RepID=UPI0022572D84|nr:suppressor of fused domain protein [Kitasatospora purpeofusca]MCX4758262.1 suppressor of fused domain protein [Kitasatospora purpeofusca]WSR31279.1 suppressor of fused domain protein [Kitasatospora purpeofusca]